MIRLATVPEDSAFTSIAERLQKADAGAAEDGVPVSSADAAAPASSAAEPLPTHPLEAHLNALPRAPLMPFDATDRMAAAIPLASDDYLELVDTTGRVIREDKRGYIPGDTPRIMERLNIDPGQFIATAGRMLDLFSTAIGTPEPLTAPAWRATLPSCAAWVPRRRCLSGRRPDRKTSPTVPVQEADGSGHRRRRTAVICRRCAGEIPAFREIAREPPPGHPPCATKDSRTSPPRARPPRW